MTMTLRLASLSLLALLALPSASFAQADLRVRLAELRRSRPANVAEGTFVGIEYHLDVADRIERRFPAPAAEWRARASRFLDSAASGRDPYAQGGGQILNRGYRATFSPQIQGYAIYLPPNYDPSRRYPMLVMLHGGSSNGNLFLGVVLGNNMDWETYSLHLWDDYTPRWSPDWIVVAPDGVGQVIWRWMGEQDVLEVIDDVQRHYAVDPDRVVLGGLSNGGMGAYTIGSRHAWRFSQVQAIAGAPSWIQYGGGRGTAEEMHLLRQWSAMELWESTTNTDFRYYHGTQDPGPMRPAYVRALTEHVRSLGLTPNERWFEHGHDLLYLVHRHGRVYDELAQVRRNRSPAEVRVVSGDYRASRQHWVTITRFERYPELGRVRATAQDGAIEAETRNVLALALDLRDAPIGTAERLRLTIDGALVYDGPRSALGHVASLHREGGEWRTGFLPAPQDGALEKVPGLSGPLNDAYFEDIVHVYGTQAPERTEALRRVAQMGAAGWPLGVWTLNQRVVRDVDVTDEMMQRAHLALYGTPGDNAVLERIRDRLPIRVEGNAVIAGAQRFEGSDVGVRFIYPSPLAPRRYVMVHAATTTDALARTRNLPDFLPDFVVYDRTTTATRPRLLSGRNRPLAAGFFDRHWRLPEPTADAAGAGGTDAAEGEGSSDELPPGYTRARMRELALSIGAPADFLIPAAVLTQTPATELEPGEAPAEPPRPRRFLAPPEDPNGPIARTIASLVPTFLNYRAVVGGGAWRTSPRAVFRIRPEADCLAALDEAAIPYARHTDPLPTPVPTPVRITGPIGGIAMTTVQPDESVVVSCELAARLPRLMRILRRHGVRSMAILSALRDHPRQSFHTLGMALDIFSFGTRQGTLIVNDDFLETPAAETCVESAEPPGDARAATLLAIACDLYRSNLVSSVLTPNYNDGHRNHFHIDIRPDDPRVFVR